jgi:serpin B
MTDRLADSLGRRQLLRAALALTGAAGATSLLAACGADRSGTTARGGGAGYLVADVDRRPGSAPAGREVATVVSALGLDVHRRVVPSAGNVVTSPWSVVVALAMTRAGARGSTAREMDRVLGVVPASLGPGVDWLDRHLGALAGTHENVAGKKGTVALASANSVWAQRGVRWQAPFLAALARDYGAGLRVVDFGADPGGARRAINAWVSRQTHDRIADLIPDGTLDDLTRLVLVNALWLRAPWHQPFDKSATTSADFLRPDGSRVRARLMSAMLDDAGYADGNGWQAATIPYAGRRLAMTIVVPRDGTAIAEVEARLAGGGLARLLAAVRPGPVRVELPRWSFRSAVNLKPVLAALGMPTAFTEAADFSGMTTQERLLIAAVVQQTFVDVDEEGTEAAAATAVVMRATSAVADPDVVRADRAFLFVVHDVATGTPLFLGRVGDPTVK